MFGIKDEDSNDVKLQYLIYLRETLEEYGYTTDDKVISEIKKGIKMRHKLTRKDIDELTKLADKNINYEEILKKIPFENVERFVRRKKIQNIDESNR